MSKYEKWILTKYENGVERVDIIEDLALAHDLGYKEAEEVVNMTILRNKNMKKKGAMV